MYSGLELFQEQHPFRARSLETYDQENQLSVALGQLVLLAIHMNRILALPQKHSMVYNSARSSIVHATSKETSVLPLYIS